MRPTPQPRGEAPAAEKSTKWLSNRLLILNQMAKSELDVLDACFAALADPTRRRIVERLERGPATVGELAEPFAISLPAVSKHIRVLEDAGMVDRRREGRVHRCRLRPHPLREAAAWVSRHKRFWDAQLDSLEAFLADHPEDSE